MAAVSQVDSEAWPYQSSGNNHLQTVWSDLRSDTFNMKDIKASGLYWGAQSLSSITSHSSEKERPRGEERWPEGLKRTAEMKPMESSPSRRGKSLSFWRQRRPTTTSHETQLIWIAVVSLSQIGLFSLRKRCTHVFYLLRPIIFCSFSDE